MYVNTAVIYRLPASPDSGAVFFFHSLGFAGMITVGSSKKLCLSEFVYCYAEDTKVEVNTNASWCIVTLIG